MLFTLGLALMLIIGLLIVAVTIQAHDYAVKYQAEKSGVLKDIYESVALKSAGILAVLIVVEFILATLTFKFT